MSICAAEGQASDGGLMQLHGACVIVSSRHVPGIDAQQATVQTEVASQFEVLGEVRRRGTLVGISAGPAPHSGRSH